MNAIFQIKCPTKIVKFTLFENNNRALELETAYHYRPNVKHIAAKYHHFSEHITKRTVSIEPIDTKEQIEDQLIKEPTG